GELTGYVDLDDSGLEQGAKRGEASVAKMSSDVLGHLDKVEATKAVAKLDADAGQLRSEIGKAEAELGRLRGETASVTVTAQIDQAEAKLNSLNGALSRVESQKAAIKVDADTGPAESKIKELGSTLAENGKTIGLAGGAAVGGAFGMGLANYVTFDAAQKKLEAQLGGSSEYAAEMGKITGDLYSQNYGASLEEVGEALRNVVQSGALMEDASTEQIQSVTGQAMSLASAFGVDVADSMLAVSRMVANKMVPDATAGLDLITVAFQQLGPGAADVLDTFTEYSAQFRKVGIDGQQALGMIKQMMDAGARSTDLAADAIKEFSIRSIDGSKTTADAFTAIGMDAGVMARRLSLGGESAKTAMAEIIAKLKAMPPSVERSAAAVGLFGTQAEDLGESLFAIDTTKAVGQLGNVAGAGAELDATIGDTAQAKINKMQRAIEGWTASLVAVDGPIGSVAAALVAFGGPAMGFVGNLGMVALAVRGMDATMIGTARTVLVKTGEMIAALVRWAVAVAVQGAKAAASMAVTAARFIGHLIAMAAAAALHTAKMIGHLLVWAAQTAAGVALGVASLAAGAVAYVLQWTIMAAGAMARAAVMAAAWFVALGPIGWVILAITALAALIFFNWDAIKEKTIAAWDATWGFIKSVWEWIKGKVAEGIIFVMEKIEWLKTLPDKAREFFGGLKDAAIQKLIELVTWVTGLPGKLKSAVGDLKDTLVDAGK
ncbi:MAG: phage tail tape measure protein, partial [Stackebrandtia sp.]